MSEPAEQTAPRPLDEVMLAMDVVDTLRHRRNLVDRELASDERDQALMDRLRKIYAAQGIEVTDHVLEEGVAALAEDRFVYKPRQSGLSVKLARLYVSRKRWGKWLLGLLALVIIACATWYFLVFEPQARLPDKLQAMRDEVVQIAREDAVDTQAEELYQSGLIALREGDQPGARSALDELSALRQALEQSYTIRIVNRQDQDSGIWRIPELNPSARNHYIVVEAVDPAGKPLAVTVINEETGKPEQTGLWAIRVDESVFNQVRDDKLDDGIIQNSQFGVKHRGRLKPDYDFPTTGAAITQW